MPKHRSAEVVVSMTSRILALAGDPNRLDPGTFLYRGAIEYDYQIAPQTSSAVIAELVALGLVEIRAGARAYVADIPALPNLGELAEVSERIEASALAYLVGSKVTFADLPKLVQARPTVVSCVNVDVDFHAELIRRAGSAWHWRAFRTLVGPLKLCLIQLGRSLGPQELVSDHTAILRQCVGASDNGSVTGLLSIHWARVASLIDLSSAYLTGVEVLA